MRRYESVCALQAIKCSHSGLIANPAYCNIPVEKGDIHHTTLLLTARYGMLGVLWCMFVTKLITNYCTVTDAKLLAVLLWCLSLYHFHSLTTQFYESTLFNIFHQYYLELKSCTLIFIKTYKVIIFQKLY